MLIYVLKFAARARASGNFGLLYSPVFPNNHRCSCVRLVIGEPAWDFPALPETKAQQPEDASRGFILRFLEINIILTINPRQALKATKSNPASA